MNLVEFLTEGVLSKKTGLYHTPNIENNWDSVWNYFSKIGFEEVSSHEELLETERSMFPDYMYYRDRLFLNIGKIIFRLVRPNNSKGFDTIYYSMEDDYYHDKEISFEEFLKMAGDAMKKMK